MACGASRTRGDGLPHLHAVHARGIHRGGCLLRIERFPDYHLAATRVEPERRSQAEKLLCAQGVAALARAVYAVISVVTIHLRVSTRTPHGDIQSHTNRPVLQRELGEGVRPGGTGLARFAWTYMVAVSRGAVLFDLASAPGRYVPTSAQTPLDA